MLRDLLSRRGLITAGGAALALSPSTFAQSIAPAPPGAPPDDAARIAAEDDGAEHLTIPVMLGNKGPFRFVVDTGADRSVIADDLAVALGLIRGNNVTVQGVVRSYNSRFVAVADLHFGTVERRNLSLPVLPRNYLRADGYLGLDAVDGTRVVLDFKDHLLQIERSRASFYTARNRWQQIAIPVRGSMGHLRAMNSSVENVSTTCFIDTGAQVSCGNVHLLRALAAQNTDIALIGAIPITGVTGGMIMAKVIRVGRIQLHGISFTDAVIAIADMDIFNVWGLANEPAMLIGMNFLRQFARVSIDYGVKEIRFDLAALMMARNGA
ncbi:putative aspartyl protease [Rhizomicrobium palustre]|uniref:Putative aspartyl protease n=1 Tax=Rhizomicrobium palustre TaxID=189966 RepID=A0A846MW49_9PROT|nr:aspartyl protease family protein [Rhizomicrobium palustre]NIK87302.1 putative aspartyl protease [Rhizomicrobium palustre]